MEKENKKEYLQSERRKTVERLKQYKDVSCFIYKKEITSHHGVLPLARFEWALLWRRKQ